MPSTQRTTVALPTDLLEAADEAIARGAARSRNDLIARALLHELEAFQRRLIDEAFSWMADDPVYRDEALEIADEFATSDWEALEPLRIPPPPAPAAPLRPRGG
jgi:Arc/MetJ-type ribon-helix-helix transcriptional regulator